METVGIGALGATKIRVLNARFGHEHAVGISVVTNPRTRRGSKNAAIAHRDECF